MTHCLTEIQIYYLSDNEQMRYLISHGRGFCSLSSKAISIARFVRLSVSLDVLFSIQIILIKTFMLKRMILEIIVAKE